MTGPPLLAAAACRNYGRPLRVGFCLPPRTAVGQQGTLIRRVARRSTGGSTAMNGHSARLPIGGRTACVPRDVQWAIQCHRNRPQSAQIANIVARPSMLLGFTGLAASQPSAFRRLSSITVSVARYFPRARSCDLCSLGASSRQANRDASFITRRPAALISGVAPFQAGVFPAR